MQTVASTPQRDVKVIVAGGRFKMRYARSGRLYEEPLDKALEELNSMLFFGPEIKLQQTDIRLVALNRRNYSTLDEIHNLHRVQASEVERFILRFSVGQTGTAAAGPAAGPTVDCQAEITGFKVLRGKGSAFPILVLVMSDGREDDRHLLTSAAIRGLREKGVFDPAFDIRMSPTNDMLMAYGKDAPDHKSVETAPVNFQGLATPSEGEAAVQRVQDFLNKYCRRMGRPGLEGVAKPPALDQPAPALVPASALPLPAVQTARVTPEPALKGDMTKDLFKGGALLSPEDRNAAAFAALALCLEANLKIRTVEAEKNCTLLGLDGEQKMGPQFTGFVLTSTRSLVCCHRQVTVRCGRDHTLLEDDQSGDRWRFPAPAFLGLSGWWEENIQPIHRFGLVMAKDFLAAIPPGLRNTFKRSGILFCSLDDFSDGAEGSELIWPCSREDTLYYQTALGLREKYRDVNGSSIFPTDNLVIKMNPGQAGFVGFKRTARHGIVFQGGEDLWARLDPDETELPGADYTFAGSAGVVGFALDGTMEMCAIYDPAQATARFTPPASQLMRFIPLDDLERVAREDKGFVRLGKLPVSPAPPAAHH